MKKCGLNNLLRKSIPVLAGLLAFMVLVGMGRTPRLLNYSLIFTQEPYGVSGGQTQGIVLEPVRPDGCRIVRLQPNGKLSVLTPEFASACDPAVSFDGKRILFAGKKSKGDRWNIYEMKTDGTDKRQLTKNLGDCLEPIYLPRAGVNPPNFDQRVRWITFTSTAAGVLDDQGRGIAPSLYAMSLSPVKKHGIVLWRTTYNLGGDISPTTLQDGRVLFSSYQRGTLALMTITWAGDNINPFYGTHQGLPVKIEACEMPDRTVVFIESNRLSPDGGGQLARVSLQRPLHSHQVLSKGPGRYRTPHPLPDGRLLVSYAPENQSYGIYLFDFQKHRPGRRIYDDPAWNDVDAMALSPHPEPMARIPMLEFASVLDIKGFKKAGQLQCLNVYDSDQPDVKQLKPGQVRWVRFVEGIPLQPSEQKTEGGDSTSLQSATSKGGWPPPGVKTRILGEAPVEPDGSFFVNIVGNVPFFMQLLDGQKRVLKTMRAWTWVRAGSQRGCIGCHENKELAPENRATQALIKRHPTFIGRPSPTH